LRLRQDKDASAIAAQIPLSNLPVKVELHSCPNLCRDYSHDLSSGYALPGSLNDQHGGSLGCSHATLIQSWLTGLNPELGDRVPLMRENDLETVEPEIMGAARAFLVGG
jgi:hypothetical protein